jgi:shikimate 5-dehydrogenase
VVVYPKIAFNPICDGLTRHIEIPTVLREKNELPVKQVVVDMVYQPVSTIIGVRANPGRPF